MTSITLKKNEDRRIITGHQWIFSNEIHTINGNPKKGDVVEILRSDGKKLGIGFYNPHSLIAVRFLSKEVEEINTQFFEQRIRSALELRKKMFSESTTYRVIHSESDFLPGLIIDRYNNIFSIQTFSAGMDLRISLICDAIESIFSPQGIVERNESPLRLLEQLPQQKNIVRGTIEPTIITLEGIQFRVDVLEGQKTGLFLDQRKNRIAIEPYVKNATVLDCFCNEGGFGLYAAYFGAKSVTCVDISEYALQQAKYNAELNHCKNIAFEKADVFSFLKKNIEEKKKFDVVILDPPSFTKSKKNLHTALKGYKELHHDALQLLSDDGIIVSTSCSHHVDEKMFLELMDLLPTTFMINFKRKNNLD